MRQKLDQLAERFELENPEFEGKGYTLLACFSALDKPDGAKFEVSVTRYCVTAY